MASKPDPRFLAKLTESGLSTQDAKRFGLLHSPKNKPVSKLAPADCMVILYCDTKGKLIKGFHRVRVYEPGDGPKYLQPKGSLTRAYFPRTTDWSSVKDSTVPIMITEGELKACTAAKAGYTCIGLGGVDAWQAKKRGFTLLPDLADIQWSDRHVHIIYDTDVAWKPEVRSAMDRLAIELSKRGAHPRIVSMVPPDNAMGRMGLDDYLVAYGKKALDRCIELAVRPDTVSALWGMNDEVCLIKDPVCMISRDGLRTRMSKNSFDVRYADKRHVVERSTADGGVRLVEVATSDQWLKWPGRAAARRIVVAPGAPEFTRDGDYNVWTGWGTNPKPGSVKLWDDLLRYIFNGHPPELRAWFERWCAYPIQNPGAKLYTASLFWGAAQGTGKSLLGYTLGRIYGDGFREIQTSDLTASYNGWAAGAQFVLGDEIGASTFDRRIARDVGDTVKRMITRSKVRINEKYVPDYEVADFTNYLFTSNHPDPIYIEPSDRRLFIHEMPRETRSDAFYKRYDRWFKSANVAALHEYLLRLDLGGFSAEERAPITDSKTEMIQHTAGDIEGWVLDLINDPGDVLPGEAELWTAPQLLTFYNSDAPRRITSRALARAMRSVGLRPTPPIAIVENGRRTTKTLYTIRNSERWLKASWPEMSKHWEKHFGGN